MNDFKILKMVDTLTHEYAKLITINHCPFTALSTKTTISKVEKELNRIYSRYIDGKNKDYIDEKIQSYTDEEDEPEYDDEENVKYMLIDLYKILVGDDKKDQEELDYFYDEYLNLIGGFNRFFGELTKIIYGYIFLRNQEIFDVFERPDFLINGDISTFDLEKQDDKDWDEDITFRDITGNWYPISQLDLSKMKKGEMVTLSPRNLGKDIYKLFVIEDEGNKFFQAFHLQEADPFNIIKLATNHEDILRDVIHLYNNSVFNRLKPSQKKTISDFIEKEKKEIIEILEKKISQDVIENLIFSQVFHQIIDQEKELKNKVIEAEEKYQKICEESSSSGVDDNKIYSFLTYCIDSFDKINNFHYENRSLKRESLLKITSKIYLYLKTPRGLEFLNKYPQFNQVIEEKKKKYLTDIRRGEEWFRDILMN